MTDKSGSEVTAIITNSDAGGDIHEGEPTLNNDHLDFNSMIESTTPRTSIDSSRPSLDISRSSFDIEMDDLSHKSLISQFPGIAERKHDLDSVPDLDHSGSVPTVSFVPPSNDEDFGIVRTRTGKPAPAIANITNCILAAGAVSGSYALSQSGLFLGLIAYVVIGSLMDYSLNLLVREANITGVYDYKELCKKGYGWYGYAAITFAQWGQSYGSMVSYLIIATDTFLSLSQLLTSDGEPLIPRSFLAIALVATIILPLSFLKSVSA